jgi:hypothetical protein
MQLLRLWDIEQVVRVGRGRIQKTEHGLKTIDSAAGRKLQNSEVAPPALVSAALVSIAAAAAGLQHLYHRYRLRSKK